MEKSMRRGRYVQPWLQVFPLCPTAPLLSSEGFGGGAGGAGDGGEEEDAKSVSLESFSAWDDVASWKDGSWDE